MIIKEIDWLEHGVWIFSRQVVFWCANYINLQVIDERLFEWALLMRLRMFNHVLFGPIHHIFSL